MKKVLLQLAPAGLALAAALVLLALFSPDPSQTLESFFLTPFSNAFFVGNILDQASLILLCALGFLFGMRVGVFNLGGEGQAYLGALLASQAALALPALPFPVGIVLCCLVVMLGVAILGLVSAALRQWLGMSELISSFLLSCAVVPVIDFLLSGPLRNPAGNLLSSAPVPPAYELARLLSPSSLNVGIFVALAAALGMLFVLTRTRFGYHMRLVGNSPEFARSQGVRVSTYVFVTLGVGAALQGLAGALSVYGSHHAAFTGITSGMGWNGIAAALVGRNHPAGAMAGALVFAWLSVASQVAMIHSSLNFELSAIVQGIVLLLVTLQFRPQRHTL